MANQLGRQRSGEAVEQRRWAGEGASLPRLLEREAELATVGEALDRLTAAASGGKSSGGLLAFTGAAGAGKTAVLSRVHRLACERNCLGLLARGGEQEQRTAFHVVRRLFQPLLASYSEEERDEILGEWYGIVGPCVGLCAVDAETEAVPDPQGVRHALDRVVCNLAERRGPLVLVIDDAHWADPESLGWLTSFAARVEGCPVLLVVGYRPDEPTLSARRVGEMVGRQRVRPLALAPLSARAVGALMREALGPDAEETFCRQAWQVTGGNPFQAVELTAEIRERGLAPTRGNARRLPDLAGAADGSEVMDWLDELGPSATRLAWAVAVLGADASLGLAASMAALTPAEASQAVKRLRSARILSTADGALEFVHPLIATTVYRHVLPTVRVGLHGQAARELIKAGQSPALAARHLLEASGDGNEWVVRQLRAAAREYVQAGAPHAARRCLDRALREPPVPQLRARVLYELGCPALLHDPETAVVHLRAALDDPHADDELRQGIAIRLARALAYCDRPSEATQVVEREAERAVNASVRLRLYAEHFKMSAFTQEGQRFPAHSQRLAHLAAELTGADRTERYIFGLRAWDAMVRGEPAATALEYAELALRSGGMRWTDEDWGFEVPTLVALTFLYCGRPERADELFTSGVAEFEGRGWRGVPLALGYVYLGYARFHRGRLAEAEDFVRVGLRLADRVGAGDAAPEHWNAVGSLIEILLARGKAEAAEELAVRHGFGKPFPCAVTLPDAQTVHGTLLLARGMHEAAAEDLDEVGVRLDARGMHNPAWCPWLLQGALAAHARGDGQRAEELAGEAMRRADRFGTSSAVGEALRVTARLREGTQRIDLLRRAVSQLERSPAVHEFAGALVELGAALCDAGQASEAAEHLYRGVDIAVGCGAEAVATQAHGELAAAGLKPRHLEILR